MRSREEIYRLLPGLEIDTAHDLEAQDLDFKEWKFRSIEDAAKMVVEMAICMTNGGGGTIVFGINNDAIGREATITGVPLHVDTNLLKKRVYDSTDPKITPVFEELHVPEGTGRLIAMQLYAGMPPHTDAAGGGKIRIGTDCQPLTGSLRRSIMAETGETDFTAGEIPGDPEAHISAVAMEQLREAASKDRVSGDLLELEDLDLLRALNVINTDSGQLTRAGVLLAGKETTIREHLPGYLWTHERMGSDTHYTDRADGSEAFPIALARVVDRIMADNPLTTIQQGMFHFEYRTYSETALREALMNAFCHRDLRLSGPILVKQMAAKMEISNPGGFIGGISPTNILHHTPIARNPRLVDALTKLGLVNRSNLGIRRMYSELLKEGKEPPIFEEQAEGVKVTFLASELSPAFRAFVAEEDKNSKRLSVDHLLILQYLLRHAELDIAEASRICQRHQTEARESLSRLEKYGYLERGGTGQGTYWLMATELYRRLSAPGYPERDRRIDWETAKTRVLSVLKLRAGKGEDGLSNTEIRQITHLNRHQVLQLMRELRAENPAISEPGRGRGARYNIRLSPTSSC